MKKLAVLIIFASLCSCGNSKHAPEKKVVCGDSLEQEWFDEHGNAYKVMVPGKCDTVVVGEEK